MKRLLCKIGKHTWGKIKQWEGILQRRCEVCGKLEGKKQIKKETVMGCKGKKGKKMPKGGKK